MVQPDLKVSTQHQTYTVRHALAMRSECQFKAQGHTVIKCNAVVPICMSERVVNRWNGLDQHVIDSASLNSFKTGLNRIRKTSIGFFME